MTLTAENAFRFYYWFEPNYFRNHATDLREIFRIGSLMGVDDCCEIGLRSLSGPCHDNRFLFIQSTIFLVTVINVTYSKLCALSDDALDLRRCNTRGRPSTISVDHNNTSGNWHCTLHIYPTLACDGIRHKVQVLRWTQANQLPRQLTIIKGGEGDSRVGYSQALPCI